MIASQCPRCDGGGCIASFLFEGVVELEWSAGVLNPAELGLIPVRCPPRAPPAPLALVFGSIRRRGLAPCEIDGPRHEEVDQLPFLFRDRQGCPDFDRTFVAR